MDSDIQKTLNRKRNSIFELSQLTSQFVLSSDDLSKIVNFDERANPDLLQMLNLSYDGVEGIINLLRVNPDIGLEYGSAKESNVSLNFQRPDPKSNKLRKGLLARTLMNNSMHIMKVQKLPVDASLRIDKYGQNIIPLAPSLTILGIVWNTATEDPILKILIIGSVVILILGLIQDPVSGWSEGVAILVAVLIVLTVTAGNDYYKDKKFRKLLLLQSDKKCKVFRDGLVDQISSWDLLVGDIVVLETGDEIPADGLFFSGTRLVIDESPLTGESFPVKKSAKMPFMFSGCLVSEGLGKMVVTAVGTKSSGGKIQELLNQDQQTETPLQSQLADLANLVGRLGFMAGILTFLVLVIRYLSLSNHFNEGASSILFHLAHYFVVGVTMVVVAVPEGLPLAVTISLAFSMFKMIDDKCFVRHLRASETMGQATVICTDKTGTLTENKMTSVKCFIDGRMYESQTWKDLIVRYLPILGEAIASNSTALLQEKDGLVNFVGSATECALLLFLRSFEIDFLAIRKSLNVLEQYLFTSETKSMSTILKPLNLYDFNKSYPLARLHIKGAPEQILANCNFQFKNNEIVELTDYEKQQLKRLVEQWAQLGHRTLALAFKNFNTLVSTENQQKDLVFLSLFAIQDPVRKQVPLAVVQCQLAGIQVKMVTGDQMMTAIHIAKECNILKDNYCVNLDCLLDENRYKQIVMDGIEFRKLSREQCTKVAPRLAVLSRSSPTDKHTLVTILKELGETVAVTGDGTNDSPALKASDVGFAMGICGTQIAINSCDIILLDDNFASIVNAIKWGRNVLKVVKAFLQFQLSVNIVAILTTIVGSCVLGSEPLSTVQLLWVNLIMDTLGALALATDTPEQSILRESPIRKKTSVLTRDMIFYVLCQGSFQLIVLIVYICWYPIVNTSYPSLQNQQTIIFTQFVVFQLFNEITARQLNGELNVFKGITRNLYFVIIMVGIAVIQFCMVQFGTVLGTSPLSVEEWGLCIVFGCLDVVFIVFTRIARKIWIKPPVPRKNGPAGDIVNVQTSTMIYEEIEEE